MYYVLMQEPVHLGENFIFKTKAIANNLEAATKAMEELILNEIPASKLSIVKTVPLECTVNVEVKIK